MSCFRLPRRRCLQSLVAAATVVHLPSRADARLLPNLSGLPWPSGVRSTNDTGDFAAWRGRAHDVVGGYSPRETWQRIRSSGGWLRWFAQARPEAIVIGYPMFPDDKNPRTMKPYMWQRAANGEFDMHHDAAMASFAAATSNRLVLRIGWEWNHTNLPWSCTDVALAESYKTYFRRIVDIARQRNPTCLIDWCSGKKGKTNASIDNWYPGNAHVDIVGHDRYDWWPGLTTQEDWDNNYYATYKGGPHGIGAWLDYARSKGKPLGVGEWAVGNGASGGGGDNPVFVENMIRFFKANAADIAYEIYFNRNISPWQHKIHPTDDNPQAAAAYLTGYR